MQKVKTETKLSPAPVVTLTTGVRVANFSSGHTFEFNDGTSLPACAPDRVDGLKMEKVTKEFQTVGGWTDVDMTFKVSPEVISEIAWLEADENVDVVLVPLMTLQALHEFDCQEQYGLFLKPRSIERDGRDKTIYRKGLGRVLEKLGILKPKRIRAKIHHNRFGVA